MSQNLLTKFLYFLDHDNVWGMNPYIMDIISQCTETNPNKSLKNTLLSTPSFYVKAVKNV